MNRVPRLPGPPGIQLCRAAGCRQSKKSVNAAGAGGGERPLREWPWPRGLPSGRSGGAAPSPIQPGHPPAAPCAPGLRPGGAGEGPGRGGGCPRWGSAAPRLLPGRGLGASAAPPASAPQLAAGPASPPALRGCSGVERSPRAGPPRARTLGVPAEPRGLPEERMRWEDGTRGCKWRRVLAFFPPVVWVLLGNCE